MNMRANMKTRLHISTLLLVVSLGLNSSYASGGFQPVAECASTECTVAHYCNSSSCGIIFSGDITNQAATEFDITLEKIRADHINRFIWIDVDSPGGDVAAAMRIGSILRKDPNHAVRIKESYNCLSSCVFILAGATQRQVLGRVGIHRPYYPEIQNLPHELRSARYKKLIDDARLYFERMNIRPDIVDEIFSTPPEEIRFLADREQSYYGLNRIDPVVEEALDDLRAKNYGLSKVEYYRRKSLVNNQCEFSSDFNACAEAIFMR